MRYLLEQLCSEQRVSIATAHAYYLSCRCPPLPPRRRHCLQRSKHSFGRQWLGQYCAYEDFHQDGLFACLLPWAQVIDGVLGCH